MGVVPSHPWKYGKDAESRWSKPRLQDFTDKDWDELSAEEKRSIAGHFAWAPQMPPENFTDLKLPHHDPKSHAVVWSGVRAAMAALLGARGGVNIPSEDKKKVYNHLASHYREFGKEPPEFHEAYEEEQLEDEKVYKQEFISSDSLQYDVYGSKYALTKRGAVLKVSGVLMYPGSFTSMSGVTRSFSEDDLKTLVANTTPPIKLYLTHFDREHIGYATKIWYNEKDKQIEWNGYVFERYDPIISEGVYKTSPEIDVVNNQIVGIAFVPNPAIPESMVKKMEVVAMSKPVEVNTTKTSIIAPTQTVDPAVTYVTKTDDTVQYITKPEVSVNEGNIDINVKLQLSAPEEDKKEEVDIEKLSFSEYLEHKGFSEEDIKIAYEKAKAELVPEWFSDIKEEDYKEFIKWREDRLNELIEEVKKLGFKEPGEVLNFAKTYDEKIAILKKIKENLAFSEEETVTTFVDVKDENKPDVEKVKELCEAIGIPYEYIKDRFER